MRRGTADIKASARARYVDGYWVDQENEPWTPEDRCLMGFTSSSQRHTNKKLYARIARPQEWKGRL